MLVGLGAYIVGSNIVSVMYGDRNHYVYYSKREQQIIADYFGSRWASQLHVVVDDLPPRTDRP